MSKKVDNIVEKSNKLNTLKCLDMSLTEFRFFLMYLSKINARDINSRTAYVDIREFEQLFDVKVNTTRFTQKIRQIMSRTVDIVENDEHIILTLYSEFRWNNKNSKVLRITCNDMMMPYLFELKKNYTMYTVSNIAKLNSVSKIRLYEIMKQYEKIGNIKLELSKLQDMMCTNISTDFKHFNRDTLKPAIKDINEYTDIQVSYEKNLSCRKVVALTFTIKNKKDLPVSVETVEKTIKSTANTALENLYYRCNKAYTMEQLEIISDYINNLGIKLNISTENYIYSVYANIKIKGNEVSNLFRYTFSVIEKQMNEYIFAPNKQKEEEKPQKRESSYNIDDFKDLIHTTEYYLGREDSEKDTKDDFDEIINSGVIPFD